MSEEHPPELDGEVQPPAQRIELDPETRARRAAALSQVRVFGDPVLKTPARPVEHFDAALSEEVIRMAAIMTDGLGIGLAATQLGVLHRVLVYRVGPDAPVAALINPEVEWSGSEQDVVEEGCLSLPSVHVDVERPVHVRVRARDETGAELLVEAAGLEARVLQHEIDHLDGVLILDRTSRDQRREAMRAMREAEAQAAAEPAA
jgi:peptide deformylase